MDIVVVIDSLGLDIGWLFLRAGRRRSGRTSLVAPCMIETFPRCKM